LLGVRGRSDRGKSHGVDRASWMAAPLDLPRRLGAPPADRREHEKALREDARKARKVGSELWGAGVIGCRAWAGFDLTRGQG